MTRAQRTALITALALAATLMFPDVAYADENTEYIKWGIHEAYVSGYPDGSFRPGRYMTREETASVFNRLLGNGNSSEKRDIVFTDVGADRWSSSAIYSLVDAGVICGDDKGMYRPEDNITRAEMAVFMSALSQSKSMSKTFSDISGHWAEDSIRKAATQGWISGYTDGTFKPDEYITRAETVLFINNVLGRAPENTDSLLPDMKKFSDNTDTSTWYYFAIQEAANSHEYALKKSGHEVWNLILSS